MSTHSMLTRCNKCEKEFYIDMEYVSPDGLRHIADNEKCPKCQSEDWYITDACER